MGSGHLLTGHGAGREVWTGGPGRRWPSGLRLPGLLLAAGLLGLGVSGIRWMRYAERRPVAVLPELAGEAAGTLLFVFGPGDCSEYSGLAAGWEELRRRGDVRVIGVPLSRGREDRSDPAREAAPGRPALPLRPDLAGAAERLMLRLGFRGTPFSVLLDGTGRVRVVVPPVRRERAAAAGRAADGYVRLLLSAGAR